MKHPAADFLDLFRGTSRRGAAWAAAILATGLLGTAYFARHEAADAETEARLEFDASCREIAAKIQVRLSAHEQILRSGAAFFADDDGITRSEWREFAERQKINQRLPGIQGIGFAQLVPPAELARHLQKIRAEGFPAYRIWPEGERATYTPIVFLEPFSGRNLRAFGYDMFAEPVRRAAMEQARDRDAVALSGKVTLVQEDGQDPQAGTLMYAPVYRRHTPHATVAERRASLLGWVYSPYRMRDLISAGMLGRWDLAVQRQIHLEIFDGETPTPAALLYDSQTQRAGAPAPAATVARDTVVEHAGRPWLLRFTPSDGTGAGVDYDNAWLVFGSGAITSLLLASLALSLANTRHAARQMAARLTANLRQSEERWKFALEGAGDGLWDWNVATGEIFFSARWKEMLGFAPEEIGARLEEWSQRVHPEDLPRATAAVQAHLDGRTSSYASEHRLRCRDGTWKWILDRGLVVSRGAGGEALRMIGTHADITARKDAERESTLQSEIMKNMTEGIYLIRLADGLIVFANGPFEKMFGYEPGEMIGQDVAIVNAPGEKPPEETTRAITAILVETGEWHGEIENIRKNGTRFWCEAHVSTFDHAQYGRVLVSVHTDITARKQAEAALRESEHRLRTLIESSPEAITVHRRGKIIYVNPAAVRFTGAGSASDLLGTSLMDRVHPDFHPFVTARVQHMTATHGSTPPVEMKFIRLDGTAFDVETQATEIIFDGEPAIRVVARDITEFKRAAAALTASEENYRLLFDGMLDGFALHEIICDAQGRPVDYRYLSVNPAFERLTGQRAADVVGRTVLELLPTTEPSWIERFGRVALTGEGVEFEDYSGALDKYFEVAAFRPRPGQFAVVFIDITANKRAETALRESETRFRQVLRDIPGVAVQGYAMDGTTTYWNVASEQLYGYPAEEALGRNLLDLIIPAEMTEGVRQAMAQMAATGAPIPASELLLRRKDGSRVPVFSSHAIMQNPGQAAELFCVDIDLTARKQAEAALRASEEQFRSYIEHAPMGVFIADDAGAYVAVNAAAAATTGYSLAELLTMRVPDLWTPEAQALGGAHFQRLMANGRFSAEVPFRRKDGTVGFWLVNAVTLSPTRFLAFTVETTTRKAAELALQSSLREKEALLKEVHHRVKNNLQVITSLLRMEGRRSAHPDTRSVLGDMQGRIRSMALLHESLYRSGTFAGVDLAGYLKQLVTQTFRTQTTAPGTIQLELDLASVHVEMDQALPCGLLVNELVSNALKHAFPAGRPGTLRVDLQPVDGGPSWRLSVSDTGVGLPADFAARRGQSLGLQLVADLAGQLRGALEIGPAPTGPGARFAVTFTPAAAQPPAPAPA